MLGGDFGQAKRRFEFFAALRASPIHIEFSAFNALIGRPGNPATTPAFGTGGSDNELNLQNLILELGMRDPDLPDLEICDSRIPEFGKKSAKKLQ
jgi:hypothetical protein